MHHGDGNERARTASAALPPTTAVPCRAAGGRSRQRRRSHLHRSGVRVLRRSRQRATDAQPNIPERRAAVRHHDNVHGICGSNDRDADDDADFRERRHEGELGLHAGLPAGDTRPHPRLPASRVRGRSGYSAGVSRDAVPTGRDLQCVRPPQHPGEGVPEGGGDSGPPLLHRIRPSGGHRAGAAR